MGHIDVFVKCYCFYYHVSFPHHLTLVVFHWSLSDNKSPQVSKTLLSVLYQGLQFFFLYHYYFAPCYSNHQTLVVFHMSPSDSRSLQDSSQYSNQSNNAVVLMFSILPLISHSSNLFSMPLGTVSSALTTNGITVTLHVQDIFFSSPARSKYLFIVLLSLYYNPVIRSDSKIHFITRFFLLIYTSSGIPIVTL